MTLSLGLGNRLQVLSKERKLHSIRCLQGPSNIQKIDGVITIYSLLSKYYIHYLWLCNKLPPNLVTIAFINSSSCWCLWLKVSHKVAVRVEARAATLSEGLTVERMAFTPDVLFGWGPQLPVGERHQFFVTWAFPQESLCHSTFH